MDVAKKEEIQLRFEREDDHNEWKAAFTAVTSLIQNQTEEGSNSGPMNSMAAWMKNLNSNIQRPLLSSAATRLICTNKRISEDMRPAFKVVSRAFAEVRWSLITTREGLRIFLPDSELKAQVGIWSSTIEGASFSSVLLDSGRGDEAAAVLRASVRAQHDAYLSKVSKDHTQPSFISSVWAAEADAKDGVFGQGVSVVAKGTFPSRIEQLLGLSESSLLLSLVFLTCVLTLLLARLGLIQSIVLSALIAPSLLSCILPVWKQAVAIHVNNFLMQKYPPPPQIQSTAMPIVVTSNNSCANPAASPASFASRLPSFKRNGPSDCDPVIFPESSPNTTSSQQLRQLANHACNNMNSIFCHDPMECALKQMEFDSEQPPDAPVKFLASTVINAHPDVLREVLTNPVLRSLWDLSVSDVALLEKNSIYDCTLLVEYVNSTPQHNLSTTATTSIQEGSSANTATNKNSNMKSPSGCEQPIQQRFDLERLAGRYYAQMESQSAPLNLVLQSNDQVGGTGSIYEGGGSTLGFESPSPSLLNQSSHSVANMNSIPHNRGAALRTEHTEAPPPPSPRLFSPASTDSMPAVHSNCIRQLTLRADDRSYVIIEHEAARINHSDGSIITPPSNKPPFGIGRLRAIRIELLPNGSSFVSLLLWTPSQRALSPCVGCRVRLPPLLLLDVSLSDPNPTGGILFYLEALRMRRLLNEKTRQQGDLNARLGNYPPLLLSNSESASSTVSLTGLLSGLDFRTRMMLGSTGETLGGLDSSHSIGVIGWHKMLISLKGSIESRVMFNSHSAEGNLPIDTMGSGNNGDMTPASTRNNLSKSGSFVNKNNNALKNSTANSSANVNLRLNQSNVVQTQSLLSNNTNATINNNINNVSSANPLTNLLSPPVSSSGLIVSPSMPSHQGDTAAPPTPISTLASPTLALSSNQEMRGKSSEVLNESQGKAPLSPKAASTENNDNLLNEDILNDEILVDEKDNQTAMDIQVQEEEESNQPEAETQNFDPAEETRLSAIFSTMDIHKSISMSPPMSPISSRLWLNQILPLTKGLPTSSRLPPLAHKRLVDTCLQMSNLSVRRLIRLCYAETLPNSNLPSAKTWESQGVKEGLHVDRKAGGLDREEHPEDFPFFVYGTMEKVPSNSNIPGILRSSVVISPPNTNGASVVDPALIMRVQLDMPSAPDTMRGDVKAARVVYPLDKSSALMWQLMDKKVGVAARDAFTITRIFSFEKECKDLLQEFDVPALPVGTIGVVSLSCPPSIFDLEIPSDRVRASTLISGLIAIPQYESPGNTGTITGVKVVNVTQVDAMGSLPAFIAKAAEGMQVRRLANLVYTILAISTGKKKESGLIPLDVDIESECCLDETIPLITAKDINI